MAAISPILSITKINIINYVGGVHQRHITIYTISLEEGNSLLDCDAVWARWHFKKLLVVLYQIISPAVKFDQ